MSTPFSYASLGASEYQLCSRSICPDKALPSQKWKVSYWVPSPDFSTRSHSSRHRALVCFKCNILLLQLFNNVLYKCPTTSQSDLSHPKSVSSQQPTRTAPGLAPAADWSHPVCRSSDSLTSQLGAECSRHGTEDAQPQDQCAGTVPCSRSVPCCSYGIAEP